MTETDERNSCLRVLLVDDQPLVRAGIAMILSAESDIDIVAEAGDGAEVLTLVRRTQPDVVVMDLRMPGTDGVAATAALVAAGLAGGPDAAVQVLVLTTYQDSSDVDGALRAGAAGFLLKSAVPEQFIAAVRAVAAGQGWLDPAVTRRLLGQFAASSSDGASRTPPSLGALTDREQEVLVLVAKGLSNTEIARKLVIGVGTVKTHVSHLLTKLSARDRTQLAAVAYQTGLVPAKVPPSAGPTRD